MGDGGFKAYRRQLLRWLVPGGHFVLEHWDKRHTFDWRPVGPRRRQPSVIEEAFAPELSLIEKGSEEMKVPLPLGPRVLGTSYWFKRSH